MPDAWPQLARCFAAAWRGLDESQRVRLNGAWDRRRLEHASLLKAGVAEQYELPLWRVSNGRGSVTLIGLKYDFPPEEIEAEAKPA